MLSLPLPRARTVILAIGVLYSARGLALVRRRASRFDVVSSLVALGMGIAYLGGALLSGSVDAGH